MYYFIYIIKLLTEIINIFYNELNASDKKFMVTWT